MARLKPGDAAPEFQLPDQHGQTVRLADFGGGKLLIYFYPCLLYTSDAADE